ncbi:hypothetical protein GGR55DRAFT_697355 [Xylaria sp. FL0064]|nr:hypothetical protein GGR55DRAFT_697355 [Xylaria sp. FL0064]
MNATARKPLPTARPKPVDSEGCQNGVQPTVSPAKKRTPLPTLQSLPTRMDESMRRLVAATERIAARRRRQLASINNDDEENQIDPSQSPESKGADGVVLKSGKYCCNICGSRMKNDKRRIESHNTQLHPKNPSKGSAYLRRMAKRARRLTPCSLCDKLCMNSDNLEEHMIRAHPQAGPRLPSSPLAKEYRVDMAD